MKPGAIRGTLAAAACALVGAGAQAALPPTEIQSAVLFYSEAKRVTAVESIVRTVTQVGEDRFVHGKLVFDSLTGASANGAAPAGQVQTFTRPSGRGAYRVQPGDTPLDDTFRDSRYAVSLGYDTPLGRLYRGSFGGNVSTEHDYTSIGLSAVFSRDLNLRNTTLSLGVSGARDAVNPEGGPPVPFAVMQAPGAPQPKQDGTKSKTVLDLLAGVTQVLNRSALLQVNYAISRSSGYLTDPYKLLSVVRADGPRAGEPLRYLYESRPETRTKQSLFWEGKYTPGTDVATLSYRFLWDDWRIRSHTVEARYRWQAGARTFLEPQARWYRQSAAEFHREFLTDGAPLPAHASGDYRLGAMDALTGAVKVGRAFGAGREVTLRLEYYEQTGDGHPGDAIGSLRQRDLFPTVGAVVAQIGFSTHL